jgi:hypothetical protein
MSRREDELFSPRVVVCVFTDDMEADRGSEKVCSIIKWVSASCTQQLYISRHRHSDWPADMHILGRDRLGRGQLFHSWP